MSLVRSHLTAALALWVLLAGTSRQAHAEDAGAAAARSDEDLTHWQAQHEVPTASGPIGLFRTQSATVGLPLNFRLALHLEGFQQRSFLINGDRNSTLRGNLALSLTGPDVAFLRHLELFLGLYNTSNQNERNDDERSDPQVILSLGDVAVGLKGAWPVVRGFSLGASVGVRFYGSLRSVTAEFSSTSATFDALASIDFRRYASRLPLRFHFNGGYALDRTLNLLPPEQCTGAIGADACIRSRIVETAAFNIALPRLRFALALDAPFILGRRHRVGVIPLGEYHVERAVGAGDLIVANALRQAGIAESRVSAALIQWVTLGLRLLPVAGLALDFGVDLGVASPGFRYGPPVPIYNVILGAAYAYDPRPGGTRIITRTVTTPAPKPVVREGRIRGVVRDAVSGNPLIYAIVRYPDHPQLTPQLTGEDGVFVSYPLPAGTVRVVAEREDYDAIPSSAVVEPGRDTALEVQLVPKPPPDTMVHVRTLDEEGKPASDVKVSVAGPIERNAVAETRGWLLTLPQGEYELRVASEGYLYKTRRLAVGPSEQTIELTLRRRPAASRVTLTREAIVIKGKIHFGTNNAVIFPDGEQLLDEVVEVLAKNPQIHKVSIEGHTDNRGKPERNLKLSQDRAAAVLNYLVNQGISAERLISTGFGATRPLVPNLTAANRARNRRVELRIVAQDP